MKVRNAENLILKKSIFDIKRILKETLDLKRIDLPSILHKGLNKKNEILLINFSLI